MELTSKPKKKFVLGVQGCPVADVLSPSIEEAIKSVVWELGLPQFDLAAHDLDMDAVCDVLVVHYVEGKEHKTVFRGMNARQAVEEAKRTIPFQSVRILVSEKMALYNAPGAFGE